MSQNESNESGLEGNTIISNPLHTRGTLTKNKDNQKRHWALTFQIESNCESESKIYLEDLLKKYCKKYTFELETAPSTNKLHFQIQLTVNHPKGVRFSQIKKLFPKFHIEPTVCLTKSIEYCQKDNCQVVNVGYINDRSKRIDFLKILKYYLDDFMIVYNEFFMNCAEDANNMEDYIDEIMYIKGFMGNRDQAEFYILIKIYEYYIGNYQINEDVHLKFLEEWHKINCQIND